MATKAHSILVVDDELSMREFLDVLLSKEGYKVSNASNGNQAVNDKKGLFEAANPSAFFIRL